MHAFEHVYCAELAALPSKRSLPCTIPLEPTVSSVRVKSLHSDSGGALMTLLDRSSLCPGSEDETWKGSFGNDVPRSWLRAYY